MRQGGEARRSQPATAETSPALGHGAAVTSTAAPSSSDLLVACCGAGGAPGSWSWSCVAASPSPGCCVRSASPLSLPEHLGPISQGPWAQPGAPRTCGVTLGGGACPAQPTASASLCQVPLALPGRQGTGGAPPRWVRRGLRSLCHATHSTWATPWHRLGTQHVVIPPKNMLGHRLRGGPSEFFLYGTLTKVTLQGRTGLAAGFCLSGIGKAVWLTL